MEEQRNWSVRHGYDHRFGSIVLQVKYGEETSPPFQFMVREILKTIPTYELMALMKMSRDDRLPLDTDIEIHRLKALGDTNFQDKIVLDIGGYDGWAAKMALDLGAKRAICLDTHQYKHYGWEEKKHRGVEYIQEDFMTVNLGPEGMDLGQLPDVLIFYNVLYHLKNPWAVMERLRELVKPDGVLLFCTLFRYHDGPWWYLYEPRECNPEDESVFWGPSIDGLERLFTQTGWEYRQEGLSYDRVVYRCWPTGKPHARQSRY